jgi:hypothetical protein
MSVSLAAELDHAVREAAGRAGMSLSAWLVQAAEAKLRQDRRRGNKALVIDC